MVNIRCAAPAVHSGVRYSEVRGRRMQSTIRDDPGRGRGTKAAKAHKRAMPIARLAGNGMDFADAIELHALVDAGLEWPEAARQLAGRNLAHARRALQRGHRQSARSWYLLASACFRF